MVKSLASSSPTDRGVGQILGTPWFPRPAPLSLTDFFPLGGDFWVRVGWVRKGPIWSLRKPRRVGYLQRWPTRRWGSAYRKLSIYFQRAFGPTEKCREIREGVVVVRIWSRSMADSADTPSFMGIEVASPSGHLRNLDAVFSRTSCDGR